jgi:hypothetical protein
MWAPLAPVQAAAGEGSPAAPGLLDIDADRRQQRHASRRQVVVPPALRLERVAGEEPVVQRHPEPTREMVIAAARLLQHSRLLALAQRSHRDRWGDAAERLDRGGDLGTSESVVALAPTRLDRDQPTSFQPPEMGTRRRRGHPGAAGQLAGR